MTQPLWKIVWQFLRKLNIVLVYDPAITLFGIYPKELKAYVHTKSCTWMFIAALSITAKPLEATKISFSSSMDNLSAGYTDSGILFSGEKKSHRAMQKYGRNLNAY